MSPAPRPALSPFFGLAAQKAPKASSPALLFLLPCLLRRKHGWIACAFSIHSTVCFIGPRLPGKIAIAPISAKEG